MGQVPVLAKNALNFVQIEHGNSNRNKSHGSNSKNIKIIIGPFTLNLLLDPAVTIGYLISEVNRSIKSTNVVTLASKSSLEILDYLLCSYHQTIQNIPEHELLQPIYFQSIKSNLKLSSYSPLKVLGKGGYSEVTLVRKKDTGALYAIKTLKKSHILEQGKLRNILSEHKILTKVCHPFIVKLFFTFKTADYLHFVMEFCPGGELFFHLGKFGRFTEDQARFYFAEILLAIEYLHQNNILYRDLKPENVLLDYEGHSKLVDFGLSRENSRSDGRRYSYCGSAEYMSPEMISRSGHSWGIDSYGLGSLLYELLVGFPPFYHEDTETMFWKIQNEPITFPNFLSSEAKDLIKKLLDKNVDTRLGNKFVSDIKDHPWCAEIHWKKILKKKIAPPLTPDYLYSNFDQEFTGIPVNVEAFSQKTMESDMDDSFCLFENYAKEATQEEIKVRKRPHYFSVGEKDRVSEWPELKSDDLIDELEMRTESSFVERLDFLDKVNLPRRSLSPKTSPQKRFSVDLAAALASQVSPMKAEIGKRLKKKK